MLCAPWYALVQISLSYTRKHNIWENPMLPMVHQFARLVGGGKSLPREPKTHLTRTIFICGQPTVHGMTMPALGRPWRDMAVRGCPWAHGSVRGNVLDNN